METSQTKTCDFCQSDQLLELYEVPDSAIGMIIAVCAGCNLVQSLQTKPNLSERLISTSSGATWGNIRHGKGLRLNFASQLLEKKINWNSMNKILDVGANRGDFIFWAMTVHPNSLFTAVEPDLSIVESYKNLSRVNFYGDRFENVDLQNDYFDLVYLSHTLEHADSASAMAKKIYKVLRTGGYLYLEVPNLAMIDSEDAFEEFFIDKHCFHFEREILCDYLADMGFEILYGESVVDPNNITLLLSKASQVRENTGFKREHKIMNPEAWKQKFEQYKLRLKKNREKLRQAADKISFLIGRQKVAFWGAGRQFDALVRFGNLDTSKINFLVDEYLWKYMNSVHGVVIQHPTELKKYQPEVLVVLARASSDEIVRNARQFGIKNVIKLRELMS